MVAVADLVVRRLADAGVRTLFGVPGGGSNLDLIEAAGRAGLPFVLTCGETAGAIAAIAQAEVTGKPGACLTALGPGAASVVNGAACAWLDRAPLFIFTDSHPTASEGVVEHQSLAQSALFERITKWTGTLTARDAAAVLERAVSELCTPPPGPVHLNWPSDLRSADEGTAKVTTGDEKPRVRDEDGHLFKELLDQSRRPLVIAGLGARRPADAAAIRSFCERRRVPAMVTYKAKGVVPDVHPLFAGVFTNAAIEQPLLVESDLLIGLGLDPVELIPKPWAVKTPIVYCGPWRVSTAHVPFATQCVAGVSEGLAQLEPRAAPSDWDLDRAREDVERQRRSLRIAGTGLTAQRVVEIAAARLAAAWRVTVDAGAHMFPATMLWPVSEPGGMLISNGLSTMGFALPAAIGAALADRDRPVVALTGDGGLLMCVGELMTAAREGLRIIVIVFDDAALSLIEIKQQARRLQAAGVSLAPIDWPALAGSFGVTAFVARDEPELERAIERAVTCPGPSLIDARIDRSTYADTARAIRGVI
ncbi:MAG TPA: thiamine pyrophosphate-binding protein [Vicinamibacterales bacterium]|nr:thiamine pyrophosphate-binding protein [Vicinamibacterales bacterium]